MICACACTSLFRKYRKSASCTHISALLHALVTMTSMNVSGHQDEKDTELPVTSYLCKWNVPRGRKDCTLRISEQKFQKHDYRQLKKAKYSSVQDFDPRPLQYRGTAKTELEALLSKVKGKGLGISLLLDPTYCDRNTVKSTPVAPGLPTQLQLEESIHQFKLSLSLSEEKINEVEFNTREQRNSPLWFSARKYRLTASTFGEIFHFQPDTTPDRIVLRLLKGKQFTCPSVQWGIENEPVAIQAYIKHQQTNGHHGLTVDPVGFLISKDYPFLGASADGTVHDPTSDQQLGFLEVKCPYTHRCLSPYEASQDKSFYCCPSDNKTITLKCNSNYYCQVQGQMAVGKRPWCDFVVYTTKGINVERIRFNPDYWAEVLMKLTDFYDKCFAPELVSPLHVLGQKVRDLRSNDL